MLVDERGCKVEPLGLHGVINGSAGIHHPCPKMLEGFVILAFTQSRPLSRSTGEGVRFSQSFGTLARADSERLPQRVESVRLPSPYRLARDCQPAVVCEYYINVNQRHLSSPPLQPRIIPYPTHKYALWLFVAPVHR